MIELPKSLKSYQDKASELLGSGCVKDVEFSGGTYQVLVADPQTNSEEWAFLQLDDRGKLKDSFCSCGESEANHECVHQAVAFLYLFDNHHVPLHLRFEKSLWNILGRYSADAIGTRPDLLKVGKPGHYSLKGPGGKVLFSVVGTTSAGIKRLEKIMFDRRHETEETSLKFSNLSIEELQLWRQGKPTNQLRYELSFWNDLAKLMMFWQETGVHYTIAFGSSNKKIPNRIFVHFPEMEFEFFVPEPDLPMIIPALATVKSPLQVYSESYEEIESIIYDEVQKGLIVTTKQKEEKDKKSTGNGSTGFDIGSWIYVPDDGFYLKQHAQNLQSGLLSGAELEAALNKYAPIIRERVKGCEIHDSPTPMSYAVSFDDRWNLHIEGYLFAPGDLSNEGSYSIGSWVYIEKKGLFHIEDRYFDEIRTIVPADEVADFVTDHRIWLNAQEGFRIHLSHMEADLSYRLTEDNHLTFSRHLAITDEGVKSKDFGRWVYVGGEGFFSKVSMQTSLPVRSGISIAPEKIAAFIRANRDELQLVNGFFSTSCPVEKSGLHIELIDQDEIGINPEYTLLPEYQGSCVRFFDEYVYVLGEGFYELPGDKRLPERYRNPVVIDKEGLSAFLNQELSSIESIATYIDSRLRRFDTGRLLANSIEVDETKDGDKYKLKLKFETEYGAVPVASLWWSFSKKKRFVFSEAGLIDLAEKRFNWLKTINKDQVDRRGNSIELTALELMRLNAFDEMGVPAKKDEVSERSQQILKEFTQFRVPDAPDLTGLQSYLRPYQEIGVNWLWFLYRHGLSGLLCDDMGLGKTHQAMALLVAVTNYLRKKESGKRHFLVICPTSVIYHWQEKLSAFLPELKVWTFYGANRSLETFYDKCDILLTSYGIWRNEAEVLKDYEFEVAIFDEIQIAKNYTSRIYNALTSVQARMRIGLSGTPIENHLRELKTLFDITLPSYMPGETEYREYFVRPIEKEDSQERKGLLSRLIKPFVMRRKKEDVLLDLPEKIEEIAHCDLLPQQQKLYTEVLTASRDKIIDELRDESKPIPYMHVFALLSHLKQICDHPAVYLKKPGEYKSYASGKWDLFIELLSEARESQQKIVVFSQYLTMIDIIEAYLKEHSIDYATIRGSTVNRGQQLARFKSDPKCEVFVASLQAAGLGVDLTSASVVIHYDRWWNAARENQATDRVHRIGQVRGVQVFKLMTKNTIEEHIDFLISKKGKLMEDIIVADDHQVIKKLDRQELMQLLQILPI